MRSLRLVSLCMVAGLALATGVRPVEAAPSTPTLVGVRAAHHPGFDRVVFEFRGGLPTTRRARYVDRLVGDASGLPVRIAGRAVLRVSFSPANAHDASGPTVRQRRAFALPNVLTTVQAGDFEAVTTYGIGLAKRTPFRVFTLRNPSRVVVDVRAAFPTTSRKVWFLDRDHFVDNVRPFFTPVTRPVRTDAPAVGLMDRLFAGPLVSEQRRGLTLLRSGATGFSGVSVVDRVARVRLRGGCSSGGSTVTIAGEIKPTLRALPSVDWVKILSPAGDTERPTGRRDSIPTCLEP